MLPKLRQFETVNRIVAATAVVWLAAAPLVWWHAGAWGAAVLGLCAVASATAGFGGELMWALLGAERISPVTRLTVLMAARLSLLIGLMILAFGPLAGDTHEQTRRLIAFLVIPFYFTLLAVEVSRAWSILSRSTDR